MFNLVLDFLAFNQILTTKFQPQLFPEFINSLDSALDTQHVTNMNRF